jgi:glutathione reductase (NADPH)
MKGKGIQAADLQIDWPELMRFKRSFTEPVPNRREEGFAKAGIAAFHGRARFVGPTAVQVGEEIFEGQYVVIAAGEAPADCSSSKGIGSMLMANAAEPVFS